MINLPIADHIAFRGVAFYQHDAGYIDNIFGSRTYYDYDFASETARRVITVTNAGLEKKNFNDQDIYGGRAALKIDLDDNWTATPTFMYQKLKAERRLLLRSESRRPEDRPVLRRRCARTGSGRRR